ncbi:MAG TPA: HAD family hydrolase [Pyrinomonadaceae bacterium]|nr:HAD family hydrolase [Pyrinomonadaceae bacterium]
MFAIKPGPLQLWRDGPAKQSIINFVNLVTTQTSSDFVSPEDRIAVFDNDGTLWCEKPIPIQADFLLRRIADQVKENPELCDKQPWKAVSENDYKWLSEVITKHYDGDDSDLNVMSAGLLKAYAGESIESFAEKASRFLNSSQNPVLKRPYLVTAYAPMVELLRYLKANSFTNYIASGGTRDFMRPITQQLYGITPEHVIGSSVSLEYRVENGVGNVFHKAQLEILDDGPAKAVRIWSRIGKRPIFGAGNANGDIQMLEFTAHPSRPSHCIVINHDDNDREIAYTAGAEKLIDTAKAKDWTIVSVTDDWGLVFAEISEPAKQASA